MIVCPDTAAENKAVCWRSRFRRSHRAGLIALTALIAMWLSYAEVFAQTSASALTLSLNAPSFGPGETLVLTAKLSALPTPTLVDAYVVVRLPTGQYLSLQLGGGLVAGIVPIARGVVPFAYEATLAEYSFSGGEPTGEYTWYAGLSRTGTVDFLAVPQQLAFSFSTSTPASTRTQLSSAFASGNLAAADAIVGNALRAIVRDIRPDDLKDIARALDTCVVVETTAEHQVCATPDNEFRFVLVVDERRLWRVLIW